jgi:hypothetical protein
MYKTVDTETKLITGIYDGEKIHPDGIDIPDDAQEIVGTDDRLYDDKGRLRPLAIVVEEGLVAIPVGLKLVDNSFIEKTDIEKYTDGDLPIPTGYKLVEGVLISLTIDELLSDELITQEQYIAMKTAEYKSYLFSTDWYVIRFMDTGVPIPEDIKTERQHTREKISALSSQ